MYVCCPLAMQVVLKVFSVGYNHQILVGYNCQVLVGYNCQILAGYNRQILEFLLLVTLEQTYNNKLHLLGRSGKSNIFWLILYLTGRV